jgi:hypothetical protein
MYPKVGNVSLFTEGEGVARESYIYTEPNPDLIAGVAMTTLTKNIIYLGVDWRHMSVTDTVLRAVMDYYDRNGGTKIPIELSEFKAKAMTNRVEVSWATESELNSEKFELERSKMTGGDKGEYSKIAERTAAGKSSVRLEYGPVIDKDVTYGDIIVYRLKMIDKDGRYEYSEERMVEVGGEGLWLGEPVPNPVQGTARFEMLTGGKDVEVIVYDVNGRKVEVKYELGNGKMEMDMSGVVNGTYTIVLKSGDLMTTRQIRVVR